LHLVYENQGTENTGWVTDSFIRSVAAAVAGVNVTRLVTDAQSTTVTDQIDAAQHHGHGDQHTVRVVNAGVSEFFSN
jgi:hypothetical protein